MRKYCVASFCKEIPIEILKSAEIDVCKIVEIVDVVGDSNKYLSNNLCSYSKNALDFLLCNEDSFDGLIFTNSCHAMEAMYEICLHLFEDKFIYLIDVPRECNESSLDYFSEVLVKFRNAVSEYFQVDINDEKLILQHQDMVDMYKQKIATSVEILEKQLIVEDEIRIPNEFYKMDKDSFEKLILEIKKTAKTENGINTLIYTTNYTPTDLCDVLRQIGNLIVVTEPFQSYEERELKETDDIMKKMAFFYLQNKFSSINWDLRELAKAIVKFVKEREIHLVILPVIKFCSDQVFISAALQHHLKRANITSIVLNTEYCKNTSGQILTRIEAAIENID